MEKDVFEDDSECDVECDVLWVVPELVCEEGHGEGWFGVEDESFEASKEVASYEDADVEVLDDILEACKVLKLSDQVWEG